MRVYKTPEIRNVAVVGHGGCGKSQLVSAMLFAAGAVNRLGRVDDGTTITDFDEEEIARKHTLSSSLAHAEWQKTKINIIDTPGFANFLTDARAALRVTEAAVVVVDAVAGVEVQTEKLWSEAAALNVPRIVVLNRLERDRASLDRALQSLHRDCAREIIPIQLPLGERTETVTVQAEAPLLSSRTSEVSQLIESRSVEGMPLGDRRSMNLIRMTAGAVFVAYDSGQKPNFSLAGGRTQSQMFWIDGGAGQNMRLGIGQIDVDPPVDTVQEVKILSNNYAAEYGGSAGGVMIATTKSGTNQLRGSLFEYFRHDSLDERDGQRRDR